LDGIVVIAIKWGMQGNIVFLNLQLSANANYHSLSKSSCTLFQKLLWLVIGGSADYWETNEAV